MRTKIVLIASISVAIFLFATLIVSQVAEASAADSSGSTKSSSGSSGGSGSGSSSSSTATQSRQSGAATILGTIGSLVPGLITNVAPLVLLFGIGALMMPALGMGAMGLLREGRRSSNDQPLGNVPAMPSAFAQYARPLQTSPQDIYYFTKRSLPSLMSNVNTAGLMRGMQDVLERVIRAIDNADKRYN